MKTSYQIAIEKRFESEEKQMATIHQLEVLNAKENNLLIVQRVLIAAIAIVFAGWIFI